MSEIAEKDNVMLLPVAATDGLMSDAVDQIVLALCEAQGEIEAVDKNQQGYGYKYADLANCLEAIREPLHKNKLVLVQLLSYENGKLFLKTKLIHKSGQWIQSVFPLEGGKILKQGNAIQDLGAVISYAARYSLCRLMGLPQKDPDGERPLTSRRTKVVSEEKNNEGENAQGFSTPHRVKLAPLKSAPVRKEGEDVNRELKQLCIEHGIDAGEFAQHHGISSTMPETVRNALLNFEEFKEGYMLMQAKKEQDKNINITNQN